MIARPARNKAYMKLFLFIAALFLSIPAFAEQGRFFEALYDVPVMPGLEEVPGEAMLFDKPDGRIASVVAASQTLKPEDVSGFYGATLPQMGWQKTAQNQYVREDEQLSMEVVRNEPLTVVRFTLSPR